MDFLLSFGLYSMKLGFKWCEKLQNKNGKQTDCITDKPVQTVLRMNTVKYGKNLAF